MQLDFFTLYVTIVLTSLALATVWGTIAWKYRTFRAACIWFLACLLTGAGAVVLPFQQFGPVPVIPAALGNGMVFLGFWMFWIGARRFHGLAGGMPLALAASALCMLAIVLAFDHGKLVALILAIGQMVPMTFGMIVLLGRERRSAGAILSSIGIMVGVAGHCVVVGINIWLMSGFVTSTDFSAVASFTMLGIIFSGILWNFGFAVMTIERLREEVAGMAYTDPLTGVWNRRKFHECLRAEHSRANRTGRPYALLLFDIDHFKKINDRLGHNGGDSALVHLARIVNSNLREADLFARLGGDEFCIVMPGTAINEARTLGERIAQVLRESPLLCGGETVRLTASIGISAWSPEAAESHGTVLLCADGALYAAKAAGRDKVECATAEPSGAPPLMQMAKG